MLRSEGGSAPARRTKRRGQQVIMSPGPSGAQKKQSQPIREPQPQRIRRRAASEKSRGPSQQTLTRRFQRRTAAQRGDRVIPNMNQLAQNFYNRMMGGDTPLMGETPRPGYVSPPFAGDPWQFQADMGRGEVGGYYEPSYEVEPPPAGLYGRDEGAHVPRRPPVLEMGPELHDIIMRRMGRGPRDVLDKYRTV